MARHPHVAKEQDTWEGLYKAARATMDQIHATRNELNQKSADFLKVDIETALTFSNLALQTYDPIRKRRNRVNARKGYDTIVRFMAKVPLVEEDVRYLSNKLEQLKSNLQILGEVF
jgi:hypothetical protein